MRAEQISVFLENKTGRLCEVTGILAENHVNIRALALADTSDFGVLRLIVDDTEKAKEVLKKAGFTVGKTTKFNFTFAHKQSEGFSATNPKAGFFY